MPKYDTQLLVAAFIKAADAAIAADPGPDDGGTCNLDSAFIAAGGMREKQAKEIATAVRAARPEAMVHLSNGGWQGRMLMLSAYYGQAERRTTMAEAAKKSLAADGLEAYMYYQMD